MDDKKFSYTESEGEAPPTEVIPRAKRRRFSASYKLRILEEADAATASGEVGALLRREGLYSSHLTQWRRQREQGTLLGSTQIGKELLAKVEENRKLRQELNMYPTQVPTEGRNAHHGTLCGLVVCGASGKLAGFYPATGEMGKEIVIRCPKWQSFEFLVVL
ncbi:MAG: transposase, partial [Bacteroidota bacterium]|nr:transposase [Bacteroidota bacterium]